MESRVSAVRPPGVWALPVPQFGCCNGPSSSALVVSDGDAGSRVPVMGEERRRYGLALSSAGTRLVWEIHASIAGSR